MTLLIDELLSYRGRMTLSERLDYHTQVLACKAAVEARLKRIEARRFTGEPPTDFGALSDRAAAAASDACSASDIDAARQHTREAA